MSVQFPVIRPFVDNKGRIDQAWLRALQDVMGDGNVTFGPQAALPVPSPGQIYLATDTGLIWYSDGTTWTQFVISATEGGVLTGDVTKPADSSETTLATVMTAGTFGSSSLTPTITVDEKGRITDLSFQAITATSTPAGSNGQLQFNNAGFAGGAAITYSPGTLGLTFSNPSPTREALSPLTTKGDIFVRSATLSTRLPVGTAGQFLRANSTTATGLEWANDNTIEVRFNFGDASPKAIATVPALRVVRSATITILTAFSDAASTLSLGVPADLIAVTDNQPSVAGTYTTAPGLQYAVNTAVTLTISPGTSTQGSGLVTITLEK